jgi:transposase
MAKRKLSTFERLQRGEKLLRRDRRQLQRQIEKCDPSLQIVHPDAAGIDVGNESHFVSVPAGRDERPIREFGSWTGDCHKMAEWLKGCRIRTVALQSTGVYWIGLVEILEAAGLEVYLVNAQGTKNLPGRKSDVQESEWLMKLHTYGLLRNSFRPPEEIRELRTLWRQRNRLVEEVGRTVQQMQKALTTMNVQLANVISDISGVTGMQIIRAILQGERDPKALAKMRDQRIQASEEEIAGSLEGHWKAAVLFELQQVVEAYDFYRKQIAACDAEVQKRMVELPSRGVGKEAAATEAERVTKKHNQGVRKNQPDFDLRAELRRIYGVDLTRIDGIDVLTAQVILTELGSDLSAFPDEDQFSSWLELSPRNGITGGKVIWQKARKSKNRVANALRMAAQALSHSDSYLGAQYRQFRARQDGKQAVKTMAHKLACLVYRILTRGEEYVDRGAAYCEKKRADRELAALQRKAAERGLQLVPVQ